MPIGSENLSFPTKGMGGFCVFGGVFILIGERAKRELVETK